MTETDKRHGERRSRLRRKALTVPDPRRWRLVTGPGAVAALADSKTVAEAHIWQKDGLVILEFWIDSIDLPRGLSADLVEQTFAHPDVHANRNALACVPVRGGGLVELAFRHIEDARTQIVGMTCLIEGRIRTADSLSGCASLSSTASQRVADQS
jgi:hypothetical protein